MCSACSQVMCIVMCMLLSSQGCSPKLWIVPNCRYDLCIDIAAIERLVVSLSITSAAKILFSPFLRIHKCNKSNVFLSRYSFCLLGFNRSMDNSIKATYMNKQFQIILIIINFLTQACFESKTCQDQSWASIVPEKLLS